MDKNKKLLLISGIFIIINMIFSIVVTSIMKSLSNTDIVLLVIEGVSLLIVLILSLSKVDLSKYRWLVIILSIIFFIFNIISGVIGFVVAKNIDKREKRELPKLEIYHEYKWYIYVLLFVISLLCIFFVPDLLNSKILVSLLYVLLIGINIFILRKDVKNSLVNFKEYFREYNSYVLGMYLKSLAIMFILSLSIRMYTGIDNATNQVNIVSVLDSFPIYTILLSVVFAPILEELLFRGLIRKTIKDKWFYILFSGILFGALHVIDDFQSYYELLYILVYSSLGCFLAAIYYKTNNICANIYFHFLQNFISVCALLLLKFLQ
ncbi:MAG: CPBP family intramembrane metalloprotease [Bacilli bacterium]|nr:CPBP family intramembrane metalloprotease [Bacilli bacterium]